MEWISVNDELPEEGEKVVVGVITGPGPLDWTLRFMYRYQHWCWRGEGSQVADDGEGNDFGERIEYWMPIPKPLRQNPGNKKPPEGGEGTN